MQEIPNSQQLVLRQSLRPRQQHQHLTASEPNHNPRGAPSSMSDISDPIFGCSSGDPSGNPSDNPTKDTYPVIIIKSSSLPSETSTKDLYHVPKEFTSANLSNILVKYLSGYTSGAPSIMPTCKPSSDPRYQPSSDADALKRGIQEVQVSLKISNTINPAYHLIFSSRQIFTRKRKQGSLIIYHIMLHE